MSATTASSQVCPKCQAAFELGIVQATYFTAHGDYADGPVRWFSEAVDGAKRVGGVVQPPRGRIVEFRALRCTACGYTELYAK